MAIHFHNGMVIADTQAEALAYGPYPYDPCNIFCLDTNVSLTYDSTHTPNLYEVANAYTKKQDKLVSGVNIKTLNGVPILGSGNLVSGGGGGYETTSYSSTDTILAFAVVTSTGKNADSSNLAHRGKVIGIATLPVLTGFIGAAKSFGTIQNPLWSWTIGDKIYLNGTSLSTTGPSTGWSQFIGTATASDTISVQLGVPILL